MDQHQRLPQESTPAVINLAQKDDIVIFMWSFGIRIRRPVLKLFQRNINLDGYSFRPYRVEHPKSKNKIMLVSAPTICNNETEIKNSIKVIRSQLDSMGVKLISHIYIHDIFQSDHLYSNGTPKNWKGLKKIFEGTVKMNQVSLLLTGWEEVSLEEGIEQELKIRQVLAEDVDSGLLFEHLRLQDKALAWSVLDEAIDLSCVGLADKRRMEARLQRSYLGWEEIRAEVHPALLQKEIDDLCVELNKSVEGRKFHKEIQKYFADRQARIESLLAQMDDNHEIPRKKKEAKTTLEHEYLIFRKTMWAFFEEIEKLGVEIGPILNGFYGFKCGRAREEPKRKKRFLERHSKQFF